MLVIIPSKSMANLAQRPLFLAFLRLFNIFLSLCGLLPQYVPVPEVLGGVGVSSAG